MIPLYEVAASALVSTPMSVSPLSIEGSQAGGPAKGWTRMPIGVYRATIVPMPVPHALFWLPTAAVAKFRLRGVAPKAANGVSMRAAINDEVQRILSLIFF